MKETTMKKCKNVTQKTSKDDCSFLGFLLILLVLSGVISLATLVGNIICRL